MTATATSYAAIRANVDSTNNANVVLSRVEVNQRALIDKILARYATQNAVYRELLQNSNDADATDAEIYFTTATSSSSLATTAASNSTDVSGLSSTSSTIITQVAYRNNGMPFREQDWDRLKKIAEGNPNPEKIGAFGVGAYTMFSICEEPLILSGRSALAFVWKGDSLWTKTVPNANATAESMKWTTFVLPSRDPYPLPNLVQFGEFLCASLTFTAKLRTLKVFVDDIEKLSIHKTVQQQPRLVQTPKSTSTLTSFWTWGSSNNNGVVTSSTKGVFSLAKSDADGGSPAIFESIHRISVSIGTETASLDARYVSATAKTNIPADMARRMERVTKKNPPSTVSVQIFLNAGLSKNKHHSKADKIIQSFSPRAGAGRIFIGFRTSQTTGLGAHLAAPFIPTVEREAMDLQDDALRLFNIELLEFSGILMRLTLEHTMFNVIGVEWNKNSEQRSREEKELLLKLKDGEEAASSGQSKMNNTDNEDDDEDDENYNADDGSNNNTGGVLMGFARFMARGVTKGIVSVAKTVSNIVVEATTDKLLYPPDPRPLSVEEKHAVVLMQSFCPQQSTPDPTVGMCLATGFSRCLMNQLPPVLTRSGIVRGDVARLPYYGMESFCPTNTVRLIVYQNCAEFYTVIARCRKLCIDDLYEFLMNQTLEEEKAILLIQWWVKFVRYESHDSNQKGMALKQLVRFYSEETSNGPDLPTKEDASSRSIVELKSLHYYFDKESYFATRPMIPLPPSTISRRLQEKIGLSVLTDNALNQLFGTLPIEVWAEYVSTSKCMIDAQPEDEILRIQVLACLSQEYSKRLPQERTVFGGFCHSLLANKRCIPFDSIEPTTYAAEFPGDLYLASAELKAFNGVGGASFHKVAGSLKSAGVSDEFLLALGVRKSVSIDFLFTNLDTLRWSDDPKPLIEYLRTATLTRNDLSKLSNTQYLPAENDKSCTYAPPQLYLPNSDLRLFPFVKMLQWPSESDVSDKSSNGQFLVKLGMQNLPPLPLILEYISSDGLDQNHRIKCLDFICDRLGPHGVYHTPYNQLSYGQKKQYKFLPCMVYDPIEACFASLGSDKKTVKIRLERQSPVTCFSDEACAVLGFSVIDPSLMGQKNSKLYGSLFQCESEPEASTLLTQLGRLVSLAKDKQSKSQMTADSAILLEATFASIFKYLSHRSADLNFSSVASLKNAAFIPIKTDEKTIEWYRPDQVFFRRKDTNQDSITAELFQAVEFSPFLVAAGVKEEATTKDLFVKMLHDPAGVLRTLGNEKKYRLILRRIAANPPFHPSSIPSEVKNAPFLLAYNVKPASANSKSDPENRSETISHHLAKASDIYIVDNSFYARMFPVNRAPPETDLEDFYFRLGSRYISQSIDRRFEIVGKPSEYTTLTRALKERLDERGPLLVSPSVTSRPLVPNAASLIDGKRLQVYEAKNILAVYSLDGTVRRNQTTCCARELGNKINALYVVDDFDWFDVGTAIGDLILRRCQLEDAFFISSLLEAPLEQLRNRGFPIDRIIQPEPVIADPLLPPVGVNSSTATQIPPPTIVPVPTVAPAAPEAHVKSESSQHVKSNDDHLNPSTIQQIAEQGTVGTMDDKKQSNSTDTLSKEGMHEILMQMFPDVDPKFLISSLGENPTLEDVRVLAERMSSTNYPKKSVLSETTGSTGLTDAGRKPSMNDSTLDELQSSKPKGGLRKKLGRAFGFGSNQSSNALTAAPPPLNLPLNGIGNRLGNGLSQSSGFVPPESQVTKRQEQHEHREPVSPISDAQSQNNLERILENTVASSSAINPHGIHSNETKLTSIPKEMDHDCEVIPSQSLKPYLGPRGSGKTRNGIQVFSSRMHPSSEAFLSEYDPVLECFAHVIERLCVGVFALNIRTIAIFHDPVGRTIAFNSNRSLHFNLRYFYALHFLQNKHLGFECYSYWYMTIAHELAHHMVSGHTREHGFYTENYASHYLPKLMVLLNDL